MPASSKPINCSGLQKKSNRQKMGSATQCNTVFTFGEHPGVAEVGLQMRVHRSVQMCNKNAETMPASSLSTSEIVLQWAVPW